MWDSPPPPSPESCSSPHPWIERNRTFVADVIAGYEWRRAVELELRAQGVTSPLQVYGDAGFHFVTPVGAGWYSYIPYFNGGWPRLDLYGLDQVLPELATSNLDAFLLDCERRGITHVVLSGTAGYLLPALSEVYDGDASILASSRPPPWPACGSFG